MTKDLVIVGGGPAGLGAAITAYKNGVRNLIIIEREARLGGILKQCIHNGFGLHRFKEELTGPEYAEKDVKEVERLGIEYLTETTVLEITPDKKVIATNSESGIFEIDAKAIILAMGCRERPRGMLNIPGERPAGIFSAGTAQKLINEDGYMPGKNVVILGSGDIGLIMARRMTLEGASVKAVLEVMPFSGGLNRNIVQCLNDFNIPLMLSTTVKEIHGKQRITGVTIAKVDQNRKIIEGTEEYIECDTLLLSCGLIPENELTLSAGIDIDPVTNGAVVDGARQTSIEGVFACGNVLHVHDLVDYVSEEAEIAGLSAVEYLKGEKTTDCNIKIKVDGKVRYTVPQVITKVKDTEVYFRVANVYKNAKICVYVGEQLIYSKKKLKFAPGEMEKVILKGETLKNINELTFKVEG